MRSTQGSRTSLGMEIGIRTIIENGETFQDSENQSKQNHDYSKRPSNQRGWRLLYPHDAALNAPLNVKNLTNAERGGEAG